MGNRFSSWVWSVAPLRFLRYPLTSRRSLETRMSQQDSGRSFSVHRTGERASSSVATAERIQRRPIEVEPQGDDIEPPEGFIAPEPRLFRVRNDHFMDFFTGALASLVRGGSGAFVTGYRLRIRDNAQAPARSSYETGDRYGTTTSTTSSERDVGAQMLERLYARIEESSAFLPASRPAAGTLKLYEFEACPFCRKVREAMSALDLDVLMFPCPKGGERYRPFVQQRGGKAQFPFLIDENTGFEGYESDAIIQYLFKTYGDGRVPLPLALGPVTNVSAGMATMMRAGRGMRKAGPCAVPRYALELWAYEASPFSKLVRERLVEYELPYVLHNAARGSVNREVLRNLTGRVQVPYLIDPNTGISMFESAEILDYLDMTYGPNSKNVGKRRNRSSSTGLSSSAPHQQTKATGTASAAMGVDASAAATATGAAATAVASTGSSSTASESKPTNLNPDITPKDEKLEAYCSDPQNVDSDECRVYDD
jgi:glutathione S-transferase